MLLRLMLLVAIAGIAAEAAEARPKRVRPAAASPPPAPALPPAPAWDGVLRIGDPQRTVSDRWMLRPIASDYGRDDPYAFRLRLRGTTMKMRVPLDLR